MFLVKNKFNGMYYKNGGYRGRVAARVGGATSWTNDASKCKPFLSVSGAKNALNGRRVLVPIAEFNFPDRVEKLKWDYRGWKKSGQFFNIAEEKAKFLNKEIERVFIAFKLDGEFYTYDLMNDWRWNNGVRVETGVSEKLYRKVRFEENYELVEVSLKVQA